MNKKQKEAKRKNAQAHQKKVKDLTVQREEARVARGPIPERRLYKAEHVVHHAPPAPVDSVVLAADVFEQFFAEKLKDGVSGVPDRAVKEFLTVTSPYPCPVCK